MAHKMTELDAKHAHYAETPWHKLGTVGHIWPVEAEEMFDWAEVEKRPLYVKDPGDLDPDEYVPLGNRQVLQMVEPWYRHIAHA